MKIAQKEIRLGGQDQTAYRYCVFFIMTIIDDKSDQTEGVAGTTAAELMKYFSTSVYKGFQDNNAVSTTHKV